jgi:hypothetical protein
MYVNILAGVKTRYLKGENKLSTKKPATGRFSQDHEKKDRLGQTEMMYHFKHIR